MVRLPNGCRFPMPRPSVVNVRRLDMGCLPVVEEMNRTGIMVDVRYFQSLDQELAQAEQELGARIDALAGRHINPESGPQVATLLFRDLGLTHPAMRLTPSGDRYSTDQNVLAALKPRHPLVGMILDHRELRKLRTTYTGPLQRSADSDGRVRTRLKLTATRSGRLASEDPNLQNIPVRGDWGRRIRGGFVSAPGCLLVSCDLSQIEMRVTAHESGDSALRRLFTEGLDIHTQTAIALFGLAGERISGLLALESAGALTAADAAELKEFRFRYRLPAKTLGFAVLYGVTPSGLQLQIMAAGGEPLDLAECEKYIQSWFRAYPKVRDWMELQYGRARRYGLVWDFFGRHRYVPEVRSVHARVRSEGLRQAGNHPVQAGAQAIIKTAMFEQARLMEEFRRRYPREICRPLLQIHDETIFECSRPIAEEFANRSRAIFESAVPLEVPVLSSATVADNWGELK